MSGAFKENRDVQRTCSLVCLQIALDVSSQESKRREMESSRGRLRHFSSFPSSVLNSLRPMRGSQVSCCTLLICKSQQKATPDNFGNNFCISSNLVNFVCFTWHSMLSRIAFCYYYFLSILFSSFSSFFF